MYANVGLLDLLDSTEETAQKISDDFGVNASGQRLDVTDQDATNVAFEGSPKISASRRFC